MPVEDEFRAYPTVSAESGSMGLRKGPARKSDLVEHFQRLILDERRCYFGGDGEEAPHTGSGRLYTAL